MLTPPRRENNFNFYSPNRQIQRAPSDECFNHLRQAPRKGDRPLELQLMHEEVAQSFNRRVFDNISDIEMRTPEPEIKPFDLSLSGELTTAETSPWQAEQPLMSFQ